MSEKEIDKTKNLIDRIKPRRMIYPILIGLGVVGYMFWDSFDPAIFDVVEFTGQAVIWISVAIVFMVIRDLGYIIRLRILTDNDLSWRQSFRVIMLWEFTSAVTPSVIGGTSLAILFVNKENISVGRSSAVVMATSLLDELYFILMFPLLLLFINLNQLFGIEGEWSFLNELFLFAAVGYSLKLLYFIFLSYGLFKNPRGLKWLILWVFKLPFLRRWRQDANVAGNEIIDNSKVLQQKSYRFWLKAFLATFFSWSSRYWVVNALFVAFFVVDQHFLLFARQLVMWIMMLVSPTPGGSGFTEYVFTEYLSDFLPAVAGVTIVMAFLWRIITYYPYLVIGAIMLPRWLKTKFTKKK